jgi:hypothetical protein
MRSARNGDADSPVISVDKEGLVRALRERTAVLIGSFDGAIDKIQVRISTKENAPPR